MYLRRACVRVYLLPVIPVSSLPPPLLMMPSPPVSFEAKKKKVESISLHPVLIADDVFFSLLFCFVFLLSSLSRSLARSVGIRSGSIVHYNLRGKIYKFLGPSIIDIAARAHTYIYVHTIHIHTYTHLQIAYTTIFLYYNLRSSSDEFNFGAARLEH